MDNITMQLELNLNWIELNSNTTNFNFSSTRFNSITIGLKMNWIEFKANEMQIDKEGIQNLLMNMVLEKKT
jgi:hypothetical protein